MAVPLLGKNSRWAVQGQGSDKAECCFKDLSTGKDLRGLVAAVATEDGPCELVCQQLPYMPSYLERSLSCKSHLSEDKPF